MVDRYYFKSYRLFKIPFKILLTYHCPLGNTIHTWTTSLMLGHILAIRNDLHILNLGLILIQIRKALNSLFTRLLYRGSFLIYAQGFKALKIEHGAVFNFVTSWLPGLITNYKQIVTSLHSNRYTGQLTEGAFLSRPQMDALTASNASPVPPIIGMLSPKRWSKYGRIPSIALSVLDNFIWLNECHSLSIPSIQLCDTQSIYDRITYPIIANQRSIPFTQLIINLFAESCTFALMSQHYMFTTSRGKKTVRRFKYKTQVKRGYLKASKRRDLKASKHKVKTVKKKLRKLFLTNKKPTYLFNKVVFMYNIRNLLPNKYKRIKKRRYAIRVMKPNYRKSV